MSVKTISCQYNNFISFFSAFYLLLKKSTVGVDDKGKKYNETQIFKNSIIYENKEKEEKID